MNLLLNNNFETLELMELENLNGGFNKNDALGIFGSACYIGGVGLIIASR